MTKPRTIWAVTSGQWSDYGVVALFESEADAQRAMDSGAGDDVQEMPLFPVGSIPRRVLVHYANATAHRTGRLADVAVKQHSAPEWDLGDNPAPRRPRVTENRWKDGNAIHVHVVCANAELAEKALRDRLAALYAEFAGVTS